MIIALFHANNYIIYTARFYSITYKSKICNDPLNPAILKKKNLIPQFSNARKNIQIFASFSYAKRFLFANN